MSQPNPPAELKFLVTNTLIVGNIQRSVAFYRDVLGATVLREGEPTFLRLGNVWLIINGGGGPTDDKPEVIASPPRDPNVLSIFMNLRVTDIRRYYDLWSSRGAKFITEPKVHATELRCYMRDPDGYLIEVGQTTMTAGPGLVRLIQNNESSVVRKAGAGSGRAGGGRNARPDSSDRRSSHSHCCLRHQPGRY